MLVSKARSHRVQHMGNASQGQLQVKLWHHVRLGTSEYTSLTPWQRKCERLNQKKVTVYPEDVYALLPVADKT